MFLKTTTGLARPGRLTVARNTPRRFRRLFRLTKAAAIVVPTLVGGAFIFHTVAAPAQADEETSREVRRYEDGIGGQSSGNACIKLLRQRGVVFTRLPDKKPKREGGCGYENAVEVTAIGSVKLRRPARLRCEVAARLEWWLRERIQPTAVQTFGQPVKEIDSYSGYSCRNAFGLYGGRRMRRLSQHGRANALDIGGFVLENGEKIDYQVHWRKAVKHAEGVAATKVVRAGTPKGPRRGWRASYNPKKDPLFSRKDYFLRKISFAACTIFNKVFTPDWDYHHRHHIHIDLASDKLCGYASPSNHRMTAAAQVPSLSSGARVSLAAFRQTTIKVREGVTFITRSVVGRSSKPARRTTLISAAEDRYAGPDRGAEKKRAAAQAAAARAERAERQAAAQARQNAAEARRARTAKRTQVAARPNPRRDEPKKIERKSALGRVLGILLGRQPVERTRPETRVASRTVGGTQASDASPAGGNTAIGPVSGLGKPGGQVIVVPRPRGVVSAPVFVQVHRRAAVLLD